ncbi:MAG: tetratricopeptide repeat protein [Caldiserica bacterium]|nr:tetratricopeptide repeat protein [Caldisericota bacterium]
MLERKEKIFVFILLSSLIATTLAFLDTTPFGFLQVKYTVAGFFIILAIFCYPYKEIRLPGKSFLLPLLFFLPAVWIDNPMRGGKVFTWWVFLVISFLLFYQVKEKDRKIFRPVLYFFLLFISFLAVLDFFSLPPFLWKKFGGFPPQIWVSIGNSNMVGEFLVLLLPFALIYSRAERQWRGFWPGFSRRCLVFLPAAALILTFSKGCILGFSASLLFFYSRKKKKVLLVILGITVIFLLVFVKFAPFRELLTFQGRQEVWRVSWNMLKEKPVSGWGWGSYKYYLPFFKDKSFHRVLPEVNIEQAHNDYLQVAVEGGIISLVAFLFLLFQVMRLNTGGIWFVGGLALILEGLVSFPFHTPLSSLLFFSLAGLEGRREGLKVKIRPALLGLIISPLFIFFLLFPLLSHLQFRTGNQLSRENKFAASVPYYYRSIALDPSLELSYVNLGFAYFRLGDREEAKKQWEKALKIAPASLPALLNLKAYYESTHEKEKEKEIDAILRKVNPALSGEK